MSSSEKKVMQGMNELQQAMELVGEPSILVRVETEATSPDDTPPQETIIQHLNHQKLNSPCPDIEKYFWQFLENLWNPSSPNDFQDLCLALARRKRKDFVNLPRRLIIRAFLEGYLKCFPQDEDLQFKELGGKHSCQNSKGSGRLVCLYSVPRWRKLMTVSPSIQLCSHLPALLKKDVTAKIRKTFPLPHVGYKDATEPRSSDDEDSRCQICYGVMFKQEKTEEEELNVQLVKSEKVHFRRGVDSAQLVIEKLKEAHDHFDRTSFVNDECESTIASMTPVEMRCGHVYGRDCLRKWLTQAAQYECPICRKDMRAPTVSRYKTLTDKCFQRLDTLLNLVLDWVDSIEKRLRIYLNWMEQRTSAACMCFCGSIWLGLLIILSSYFLTAR